jgi:hypothetical protein
MFRYLTLTAVLLGIILISSLSGLADRQRPVERIGLVDAFSCQQLVFFAVLEGLYVDGVSTKDVDLILAVDPSTNQPRPEEHFVRACPLCMPAFDAFQLYRTRPRFFERKNNSDTFGIGLDPIVQRKLHNDKRADQLEAIQGLIDKWVRRRLDAMRLSKEERADWAQAIEEGRKQGMERLRQDQANGGLGQYWGWKRCAICDGTAGACRLPR